MTSLHFSNYLVNLTRKNKAILTATADSVLIVVSVYVAIALRLSTLELGEYWVGGFRSILLLIPIGLLFSIFLSVPWISTRAFNLHGIWRTAVFAGGLGLFFFVFNIFGQWWVPRSSPLIFIPVFLVGMVMVRIVSGMLLERAQPFATSQERILIYGAGAAGRQLADALQGFSGARAVAFVDDNPSLRGVLIGALRIYGPHEIDRLMKTRGITQVILAMPSARRVVKNEILLKLQPYGVELKTLPHFVDFISGASLPAQLKTVKPDDLLGRAPQALDMPEISDAYANKSVMITGAGGSIGSELVWQLANVPAKTIVLYEHSETALYQVERRLLESGLAVKVVSVLASVLDQSVLERAMKEHEVDVVLHAAAYKHVPLVESNEIMGARNNALGTYTVAKACADMGVPRFILISTDKAVRPTNVMGATKRFAEMLIQDLQTRNPNTVFSMVRFGNVLGSSGSVIPLFREQIANGGPITVTHPEVTRFFMTISEAARLVLLAGTFSHGGEVFVLDMGQPMKITDLARNMIVVSGLKEKTEQQPDGDIEIVFVGLRPGEKLYEELLIEPNQIATPHPKIMCAQEKFLSPKDTAAAKAKLEAAIEKGDSNALRDLFKEVVDGYPEGHIS